jgi:hypothetical protein
MYLGGNTQTRERYHVAQRDGLLIVGVDRCRLFGHESVEEIHTHIHNLSIKEKVVHTFIVPLANVTTHGDIAAIATDNGSMITGCFVLNLLLQKS